MKVVLWVAAVIIVIAGAVAGWATMVWWPTELAPVGDSQQQAVIQIPRGATTQAVARLLRSNNLIRNELVFRLYARLEGLDGRIKAGEYQVRRTESLPDILERLVKGDVITYKFTIPEGYRVEQIVDLLVGAGYADRSKLEELVQSPDLISKYYEGGDQVKQPLEGFLFPDTYTITKDTTEEEILKTMVHRFEVTFTAEWKQRADELNMSVYQVVTLASIIEKEARKPEERPIISAVYHNRLKRGMNLDADPTVQYGLDDFEPPLLFADLDIDTPYNTYMHTGLPPGPIANPGEDSIKAALYPADEKYLYFVACTPDGAHAFSNTLAEQNRNIRRCRVNK